MMLTGYPVEDLALRASFVDASAAAVATAARRLAAEGLGGIAVVTGYLDRRTGLAPRVGLPAGAPLDAAALLYAGAVAAPSAKHHLPNYGVFDEYRYFVPGDTLPVFRLPPRAAAARRRRHRDLRGPVAGRRPGRGRQAAGAGLLVVPNASPYESGKDDTRLELCQRRAREAGAALAYVEHGRRPGRTRVRRRLDHRRRRGAACWPAGRSSTRPWSSPTWTCPPPTGPSSPAERRPTRGTAR